MNAKSLSLALLLLAAAAPGALAQDRPGQDRPGQDHRPSQWNRGEMHRGQPPATAPQPPQAPQARPAPEPRAQRSWRGGDPAHEGNIAGERGWGRRGGDHIPPAQPTAPRPDEHRNDWRDDRQGDHRWGDRRWGDDRRWRDDDRRGRPAWEYDRRVRPDRPAWRPRAYPPIYDSPARYHHAWRPPPGYYVRNWRYGEFLPGGWYARDYWISDWWAYDLPEPPYGYAWVRTGPDVLLVDVYTGRIVQVVRLLFW